MFHLTGRDGFFLFVLAKWTNEDMGTLTFHFVVLVVASLSSQYVLYFYILPCAIITL